MTFFWYSGTESNVIIPVSDFNTVNPILEYKNKFFHKNIMVNIVVFNTTISLLFINSAAFRIIITAN